MFVTILLIGLVLLTMIMGGLFAPIKIKLQGSPFLLFINFLGLKLKCNINLELQISFFYFKKNFNLNKLAHKKLAEKFVNLLKNKKLVKKIVNLLKKEKPQPEKTSTTQEKAPQYSQVKKSKTKRIWKAQPSKLDLLKLAKKIFFCFRIQKIYWKISWQNFDFVGVFYALRMLLPLKFQKNFQFSFYQQSSYQLVIRFCFGSLLWQIIAWYTKLFFQSKTK